jgi:hypothetical protein
VQGGTGVSVPGAGVRYAAVAGAGGTIVERVRVGGAEPEAVLRLPGDWGIPAAAYDNTTTGLSADGRTLVVAPAMPDQIPTRTRLTVLDTSPLRVRSRVEVPGYASVDAISPDGRWLYLTVYKPDLVGYAVRAYDLAERRLLPEPVVDPSEPDEQMQGLPMTRTMSADGRWAYTLYMRPEGEPFVHALDTSGRTAACIDLPALEGRDLSGTRLELRDGGGILAVVSNAGVQARIDLRKVAARHAPAAPAAAGGGAGGAGGPASRADGDGGLPVWPLLAAAVGVLAVATLAMGRRRRALGS